jgi:hypothetical protein
VAAGLRHHPAWTVTDARTACDRRGQAWTLNQLGVVQRLTGDYPAAAASLARALDLFRLGGSGIR